MKINEPGPLSTGSIATPAAKASPRTDARVGGESASTAARPAVDIQLSSRSRELHAALEAARQTPDVREAKVADVKSRIESGDYRVDLRRVAQRMLDREA